MNKERIEWVGEVGGVEGEGRGEEWGGIGVEVEGEEGGRISR